MVPILSWQQYLPSWPPWDTLRKGMGPVEVLWDGDGVPLLTDRCLWKHNPWDVVSSKKVLLRDCKNHVASFLTLLYRDTGWGVPLSWVGVPLSQPGRIPYPGWGYTMSWVTIGKDKWHDCGTPQEEHGTRDKGRNLEPETMATPKLTVDRQTPVKTSPSHILWMWVVLMTHDFIIIRHKRILYRFMTMASSSCANESLVGGLTI